MLVSYLESHQERKNLGSWSGVEAIMAVYLACEAAHAWPMYVEVTLAETYGFLSVIRHTMQDDQRVVSLSMRVHEPGSATVRKRGVGEECICAPAIHHGV